MITNPTGQIHAEPETNTRFVDTNLIGKEGYAVNADLVDVDIVNLATAGTTPSFPLLEGQTGTANAPAEVTIAVGGECLVSLGATAAQDQFLMPDGNGQWIPVTTGKYYGCQAKVAGVAGDVIPVQVRSGVWSTVS